MLPSAAAAVQPLHLLRLQNLQVAHADWCLCQGWSHAWPAGLHLLSGGDGAGKSSLLRVLAGAQPPRAGQVERPGQGAGNVFWVDPRQPEAALEGAPTARQWLPGLQALYTRWDAGQWQTHVQHWQLEEAQDKPWHALSTGTARKLWMAAALASGAALVLIDEPIAGLDRPSVAYLRQVLADRSGQAQQCLLVAHYDDLQGLPWDSVVELEQLPR